MMEQTDRIRDNLLSEISLLKQLIKSIPDEDVIDKASLIFRLDEVLKLLGQYDRTGRLLD
jgi:hypothetical protein